MVKIQVLSTEKSKVNINNSLKKYLYKRVFSKDGQEIGRVRDVIFNGFNIEGIRIAKFRFLRKHFIDKEYIHSFSNEGIVLGINPVTSILSKTVFDKDGRNLGKVKKINRKTNANNFDSITVKKGIFSKQKIIYKTQISVIKKNIILNISMPKS